MSTQAARLFLDKAVPSAWKALNGVALAVDQAAERAGVERLTLELMYVRISQLNGCSFCLDTHTKKALAAGATPALLAQLAAWEESTVFTDAERAALIVGDLTTVLPHPDERRDLLDTVRAVVGEERCAVIEWAAVTMNAYNRVSILSEHPVRSDRAERGAVPAPAAPAAAAPVSAPTAATSTGTPAAPAASAAAQQAAAAPASSSGPKPGPQLRSQAASATDEVVVADNPAQKRFEISVNGVRAGFSEYKDTTALGTPQRIFFHTEVDKDFGGRGLAGTLTEQALSSTVESGKRVVAICPYVKKWIETHPQLVDRVDPVAPTHLQLLR